MADASQNGEDRVVDLNKSRAARYEKRKNGPKVVVGKLTLQCPREVPFAVVEAFGKMEKATADNDSYASSTALREALSGLLGRGQFEQFMNESPSTDDMVDLINGVFELYGVEMGESSASAES